MIDSGFPSEPPRDGERVLCLAPPGDLSALATPCIASAGAGGRVVGLVEGDPFLHGEMPASLEIHDGDAARPHRIVGPFDAVFVHSSTPFLAGFEPLLQPIRKALRPGGRCELFLPAYGFSAPLQASDPRAARWFLPSPDDTRAALEDAGLRDVEARPHIELTSFDTIGALLADLIRPYPLAFEGKIGVELTEALRNNLAQAFQGAEEVAVSRRYVVAAARR